MERNELSRKHQHKPTPVPPPVPGPPTPPPSSSWIWGVTTDEPAQNTAAQAAALAAFKNRATVRAVFDLPKDGVNAASYVSCVQELSAVANVMGLLMDSSYMPNLTLAQVQARVAEYVSALQSHVSIWEVGNEINGNWLGTGVVPKVQAMYDAVKAAGKLTACTFYYENPATPGFDMLPWIDENIPGTMRTGLDYVLVSYYEDQNGGHQLSQSELDAIFGGLATRFPNAKVGFGECGWPKPPTDQATRIALYQRFYNYKVPSVPAYIGGCFLWNWAELLGDSPALNALGV